MGEPGGDWLEDISGRDRVVVPQKPLLQPLKAVCVPGKLGEKKLELLLWDEARKRTVAVPVPQQALQNPSMKKYGTEEKGKTGSHVCRTSENLIETQGPSGRSG